MTEITQPGLFMETPEIIQPDLACVLAGVHPMTPLSPAAQAVLDAYHMRADHEGPKCPEVVLIAEALLALEEQLAQDKPAPMSSDLEVAVLTERIRMLRKISAIAAELGGQPFNQADFNYQCYVEAYK